jgi:hypothetical protein
MFTEIEEDPKSYEFRDPVPWKELGLNDYPEIIKKPMDLRTCRKNLIKSKYKTYQELFFDLQLIWDNCKQYNIAGSDIYKLAEDMEKISKKAMFSAKEELSLTSGKPEKEEVEEVSFEEKVAFTEKVRRLTNQGLTRLVTKVKELCKEALEDVDAEKLHI